MSQPHPLATPADPFLFMSGPYGGLPNNPVGEGVLMGAISKPQEGMWFDYLTNPNAVHYNLTLKMLLEGTSAPLEKVVEAIHHLVQRHSILRSVLRADPLTGRAMIWEYPVVTCVADVRVYDARISEEHRILLLRKPFSLENEFPARFSIFVDAHMQKPMEVYVVGHHIAVDGISMSNLSKELWMLIEAEDNLPVTSVSYTDFVRYEGIYASKKEYADSQRFWIGQINDTEPFQWKHAVFKKKTLIANPARMCDTWANFSNDALKEWSSKFKTSWFRVACAAIGVLVNGHAVPNGSDGNLYVAFGGRPQEYNDVVGHFANTMPIRIPFATGTPANLPFSDLVRAVAGSVSAAKKAELFPYVDLARESRRLKRDLVQQVAVTFSPRLARAGADLYPVEGVWDLFFCFLEQQDGVSMGVIYNPSVFPTSKITTLKNDFFDILAQSHTNPDFNIREWPRLHAHRGFVGPATEDLDTIRNTKAHTWIETQASLHPDNIAMSSAEGGWNVTYKALSSRSNQIAHYLRDLGVTAEVMVVLRIERGPALVEWILGVLKSGGAYVAVDKSYPIERQRYMIENSEALIVVTDEKAGTDASSSVLGGFTGTIVNPAEVDADISCEETSVPPEDVTSPSNLAYMIFTSGSTGKPKGVMIQHDHLSTYVASNQHMLRLGPNSRVLQFAPFSFDASVLEWQVSTKQWVSNPRFLAVTLAYGATLCFVEHPTILVGEYLADVIDKNAINFFHLTPSVLASIPFERDLPTLKALSVGGENCAEGLMDRWRKKVLILHAYGATETTVITTLFPEPSGDLGIPGVASSAVIGKPLPNNSIYIFDPVSLAILPNGEEGEIFIGGAQVGRGYKGRDDLNKQKFIEHAEFGRLYRTGDKGVFLADGNLRFVGRIDREVKVRGYRIELAEVEKSMSSLCPEVVTASIQVNLAKDGLIAFVTPATVNPSHIRDIMAGTLPKYMVPTAIVPLTTLPLSPSGKVDHNMVKQRQAELEAGVYSSKAMATKSETEIPPNIATQPASFTQPIAEISLPVSTSELASDDLIGNVSKIWRDVLGLESIPKFDVNFFDLGGHSLSLVGVHGELNRLYPAARVSIVELFQHATVQKQASLVASRPPLPTTPARTAKQPVPVDTIPVRELVARPPPIAATPPVGRISEIGRIEVTISNIWKDVLGLDKTPEADINFFDIGGHSLSLVNVHTRIREQFPAAKISIVELFQHATVAKQAKQIAGQLPELAAPELVLMPMPSSTNPVMFTESPAQFDPEDGDEIAIIGMAGRFPGAQNITEFWELLMNGQSGIYTFNERELANMETSVQERGIYVPRRGLLKNVEMFDNKLWRLSEREATAMDPQQRLFLDVSIEALEDAGIKVDHETPRPIGVFVGAAGNTYVHNTLPTGIDVMENRYRHLLDGTVATRTAYHLNLAGPTVTLNTACSSALVATSLAVNALLAGDCEVALAGGASIEFPQEGYLTEEGKIFSPSGHCRPFDYRCDGTVPADAVAAVVLKRLRDAERDGDPIHAVIRAIATQSDGGVDKAGFTVPSSRGQANTIKAAMQKAGVKAEDINYVEMHGSGTPLGDAIEFEGLRTAHSELGAPEYRQCIIGSNKGNFGNTEAASGMLSLIKVALSVRNGVIPPIPADCYEKPNPLMNLGTRYTVTTTPTPFANISMPGQQYQAALTALGYGGTNAHCIVRAHSSRRLDSSRRAGVVGVPRLLAAPKLAAESSIPHDIVFDDISKSAIISPVKAAEKIRKCFAAVLNLEEVDDTTSFLEWGGNSLLALYLLRNVEEAVGCRSLNSRILVENPTLGEFTRAVLQHTNITGSLKPSISSETTSIRSGTTTVNVTPTISMVTLRHGTGIPIFLPHPVGGSCFIYADIVKAIGSADTPVYGFEYPYNQTIDEDIKFSPRTIEDLAFRYASEAEIVHQKGAIRLGGTSLGGAIAYEMARVLLSRGRSVEFVALIDTPSPDNIPAMVATVGGFMWYVLGVETSPDLAAMSITSEQAIDAIHASLANYKHLVEIFPSSDISRYLAVYSNNVAALQKYNAAPLPEPVPLVYFKALRRRAGEDAAPERTWRSVARSSFKIVNINSDHNGLNMGEGAKVIAHELGIESKATEDIETRLF